MQFRTTVPPIALLPATTAHLDALERDRDAFGALIGSAVPDGWPEFPESIGFTRDRLAAHPDEADWWMHFFLLPGSGELVGSGGFVGPPRDGTVEIGYEIAPAYRGRRLGVGAAAAHERRALFRLSRPPVAVMPESEATGSTLPRSVAFRPGVSSEQRERTSAAAPETWGAAIEVPLQ